MGRGAGAGKGQKTEHSKHRTGQQLGKSKEGALKVVPTCVHCFAGEKRVAGRDLGLVAHPVIAGAVSRAAADWVKCECADGRANESCVDRMLEGNVQVD